MEPSTTLRTSGGSASRNASSIGTDSASMSRLTTASGPGLSIVPASRAGLLADQALRSTVEPLLLQRELAAQVFERIGEVAVDRRHVAADHGRPHAHRPPLPLPHQAKLGVDLAARLEDVPELVELGRGAFVEALVELQSSDVEAQVERGRRRDGPRPASPSARTVVAAVVALGVLDRQQAVLDGDAGRQVVDRERQLGTFPDPVVQPGLDVVVEPLARRRRGVVRQPVQLEVDLAALSASRVEGGADSAGSRRRRVSESVRPASSPGQRRRRRCSGRWSPRASGGRTCRPWPCPRTADRRPRRRLDPQRDVAEDGRRRDRPMRRHPRPVCRRAGVPVSARRNQLDRAVADHDRRRVLDRVAGQGSASSP